MKPLFKQTKVIYDAHRQEYIVFYKKWLFWKYETSYKVGPHLSDEKAKELAITRAKDMLNTVEVYRSPKPFYYV